MYVPRFTVLLLITIFVSSAATLLPTVRAAGVTESKKAGASAAPHLQRARLKVGMIPVVPNATIFVPLEKGYFAAEGIDLEWEPVASTSEATGQLAGGNIDLTPTTMSAALLNAWARGVDIRIVSGLAGYPPSGTGSEAILLRQAIWDSGEVRDAAGLRGRKVALSGVGSFGEYVLDQGLRTAGLTIADVDVQTMPFPNMPGALANGSVDGAFATEPFATQAMDMRAGTQILPELLRGAQLTVLLAGPTFLRDSAVAEAFMRALLRGLRDLDHDGWDSPEHAAIIEQYSRVPAPLVQRMLRQYGDPEGRVNWDSLQDQQWFFIERGHTTSRDPLDLLRFSEDGPRQAALQALAR